MNINMLRDHETKYMTNWFKLKVMNKDRGIFDKSKKFLMEHGIRCHKYNYCLDTGDKESWCKKALIKISDDGQ